MKKGFKILERNDVIKDLLKYREQGAQRGVYLGFTELHEHYSMSSNGCTDWTGFPGSGKSEFVLEMLLNTSLFYAWKHFIYVPDVGNKNEILGILIHKITGKTFDKRYNKNYITENEVENQLMWVLEHFKILTKNDLKAKITPYEFWNYAVELKNQTPGGIQTCLIDSWKDMKHGVGIDGEGFIRDDKFLEDVLSYRNSIAEEHDIHIHTVIHPNLTEKDSSGKRLPPTAQNLKGGQEWFNSGKCMITIHRVDGSENQVRVIINKAKPKSVAKLGEVQFCFDVSKSRFYIDSVDGPQYANPQIKKKSIFDKEEIEEEENDDLPF